MTLIAPSILSADFGRLAEGVQAVEAAGADWIHVDVMDGHFVPNITVGPLVAAAVRRACSLPVDVHLMIEKPERYLQAFVDAGADRITVHQETCPHLHRTLQEIRELGATPGVALNPSTPVETVRDVIPDLEMVLVMTVNPGFGGQRYIPNSTRKVKRVAELLRGEGREGVQIQVDGGVDTSTAATVAGAGATVLVAGSAVFGHADGPGAGVGALRRALDGRG
ncbi:MAG: ribulose-phosphate 3-epimerase [Longimicrobiales bacterium]